MIIYNPHNQKILKERLLEAELILDKIPAKYAFITGSFLYKENYRDIDVFVISRSKKKYTVTNKKVKITVIDFNDLHSLFYHSVSKSCLAKEILPTKPLKVTLSDYWRVVNEAIPTLLNAKEKYHKNIRYLVLYTEYFKNGEILDTFQLADRIGGFKKFNEILDYVKMEVPSIVIKTGKKSYLKRFFYTQAGFYKDALNYKAQSFLYQLAHNIINNG